jgi:stage V sporulation protein G
MDITEVRVSVRNEERLKAYVTVTFDNCFVVRHIRVVKTEKGLLVSMPSRKLPDGTHKDIAHPITQEFRKKLETQVLAAYEEELKKGPAAPAPGVPPKEEGAG